MRHVPATTLALGLAALCTLTPTEPSAAQQQGGHTDAAPDTVRTIQVKILGMSCPFCAYGVEQKLKKLEGVRKLKVELKSGIATLTMVEGGDVSNETLKKTVADAGFEAAAIVRSFASEHADWHPDRIPRPRDASADRDTTETSTP